MLVPQALMGIASVALVYDLVRRRFGRAAGFVAGLVLATTPITVAISRHNNPDALLILCSVAALWFVVRALEDGRTRWLVLSGIAVGLGFETKMAAALLVVPAIVAAYLWVAPRGRGRAIGQLLAGGAAMTVVGMAWPLLFLLTPAADRPWVSGTSDNSIFSLIVGYNGLGRIDGQAGGPQSLGGGGGPGGGGGAGSVFGGDTGPFRLLGASLGGQAGWLLGFAVVGGIAVLVASRLRRADARTGWLIAVGGAFATTAVAFSFAKGIFHPYYVSLLAPFTAALVGAGAGQLRSGDRRGADPRPARGRRGRRDDARRHREHRRRARTGCSRSCCRSACSPRSCSRSRSRAACGSSRWPRSSARCCSRPRPGRCRRSGTRRAARSRPAARPRRASAGRAVPEAAASAAAAASRRPAGRRRAAAGSPPAAPRRAARAAPGARRLRPGRAARRRLAPPAGTPGGAAGGSAQGGGGPFGGDSTALRSAVAYAKAHGGGTIAVSSQQGASTTIIDSGADVAALGGFSGRESEVSVSWLADAVRAGKIRWVLTDGSGGGFNRDGRVGSSTVMAAVAQTCTPVSTSSSTSTSTSGLYDCAGRANALAAVAARAS